MADLIVERPNADTTTITMGRVPNDAPFVEVVCSSCQSRQRIGMPSSERRRAETVSYLIALSPSECCGTEVSAVMHNIDP